MLTVGTSPAAAVVFQSNYTPSDTTPTAVEIFHPVEYRAPSASQSFDTASYVGAYCNAGCGSVSFYSAATEFVATSSYLASHVIMPLRRGNAFGNFRVGFSLSVFDAAANAWVALGGAQIESGSIPLGSTVEAELPFGSAGAGFIDFSYQPVQVVEGQRYRLLGGWGAGAGGDMQWFLSDEAAAAGQSAQYSGGGRFSTANASPLAFQPAFALTDGGTLNSAVPEPATWGLMLLGFGGLGYAMRRRRSASARIRYT
jgi:hypothetical protein